MTRGRTIAERSLAAMRDASDTEEKELARRAQRRRVVAHLDRFQTELVAERQNRGRRLPWIGAAILAVAASVALAFGTAFEHRTPVAAVVVPPAARSVAAKLVEGRGAVDFLGVASARATEGDVLPGDHLRTHHDAAATLVLALGTVAHLGPLTEVELLSPGAPAGQSEALRLVAGRVDFKVPKQPAGASFSVTTALAKVIVLGTEFSVTVPERGPTSVEVREGRVLVEHGTGSTFLGAGATWVSSAPFEPTGLPAPSATAVLPVAPRSTRSPATAAPATSSPASNLAEQNALLMGALSASRSGNDRNALSQLDTLLERYPNSRASEEAAVERFRVLRRLGQRDAAKAAARRYLASHPSGFAAEEARTLVLETTPTGDGGP